jgi:hypothetical protein
MRKLFRRRELFTLCSLKACSLRYNLKLVLVVKKQTNNRMRAGMMFIEIMLHVSSVARLEQMRQKSSCSFSFLYDHVEEENKRITILFNRIDETC